MPVDVSQKRVLKNNGMGTEVRVNGEEEVSFPSRSSLAFVCAPANASAESGGEDNRAATRGNLSAAEYLGPRTRR